MIYTIDFTADTIYVTWITIVGKIIPSQRCLLLFQVQRQTVFALQIVTRLIKFTNMFYNVVVGTQLVLEKTISLISIKNICRISSDSQVTDCSGPPKYRILCTANSTDFPDSDQFFDRTYLDLEIL